MSRPPYHIQAVRQNPDLHDDVSVASNNSSLPSHKPIRKKTSTGSHKALSHPHHGSVAGSNRLHRTASADLGSKTAATLGTKTSAGDKAEKKEEKSTSTCEFAEARFAARHKSTVTHHYYALVPPPSQLSQSQYHFCRRRQISSSSLRWR